MAKGAKLCPFYMGQKCISGLCEFFLEFKNITKDGQEIKYHQCVFVKLPLLLIENRIEIEKLVRTMSVLVNIFSSVAEKEKQENK